MNSKPRRQEEHRRGKSHKSFPIPVIFVHFASRGGFYGIIQSIRTEVQVGLAHLRNGCYVVSSEVSSGVRPTHENDKEVEAHIQSIFRRQSLRRISF